MPPAPDDSTSDERELSEVRPGHRPEPQRLAYSARGMIATQHDLATQAGAQALADGGNAIDAAVAAAFALSVCEPNASGLGGQTLMLVHVAETQKTFALDGSSSAPSRATPEAMPKRARLHGFRATTVPSTPAVLDYVLAEHGTMALARVIEPAIAIAEEGFAVSELLHSLMVREVRSLRRHPAGQIFLRGGRRPYAVGDVLRQPALAKTLRRLAKHGVRDFYRGRIGRLIAKDVEQNDGLIRADDMARPPRPIVRKALGCSFQGRRLRTFPPPGAGRVLVEMINVIENFPLERLDPESPDGAILLVEVMRKAAQDRRDRPFDPDFYAQVTGRQMVDRDYAAEVAKELARRVRPIRTEGETTHLSVMDEAGNAVGLTQSIERVFGSCCLTPELGFLYNNYMSAYDYRDIGHPHYLRPNTPPWGSVAPTILFKNRKPTMVIGSPGSERIVTSILQVLIRLFRSHTPYEAVAAPRLHCSLDGKVSLEAARFRDDIPLALAGHGFEVDRRDPFSFYLGCVQLVLRDRDGFIGVADPRRDGSAAGPRS